MINTLDETRTQDKSATSAARAAKRNFAINLRALAKTQPVIMHSPRSLPSDLEWVYARDGSLTALQSDGKWWNNCSLPFRAARFMLKKAELDGTVLCFLYPTHAAQIRVALDRAKPAQALLILTPGESTLQMLLACEDFSDEIDAHRLWFAAGEQWEAQLDQLLDEIPGLPTPTQFIRPILADSSPADEMISPAQKIFADHGQRRSERVRTLRQNWKAGTLRRICVVAPSLFRLWDDAGSALAKAMASCPDSIVNSRFNPDDPAGASSAALAAAATACDAIVSPNMGRADIPDLVPEEMPWATWITAPRIPSAEKAGPRDTLLLADPAWKKLAIELGWQANHIFVAGWPSLNDNSRAMSAHGPGVFEMPRVRCLAIISDTQSLDAPERVTQYSSHRLLWESIQNELLDNPFALIGTADNYLAGRMERAHVEEEGFDRGAFLDGVVLHAWQQGLARLLLREKLPLKLFGAGWGNFDEISNCAGGPVRSRGELHDAISEATAIIHAWPTPFAHPVDAIGKPVIRPGKRRETFIHDARSALAGRHESPAQGSDILTSAVVIRALSI